MSKNDIHVRSDWDMRANITRLQARVISTEETEITADQARVSAMIDINRDGKVDWLHERPGIVFELGDGKGSFRENGHLPIAPTRNEINVHPADLDGDGNIGTVTDLMLSKVLSLSSSLNADDKITLIPSGFGDAGVCIHG